MTLEMSPLQLKVEIWAGKITHELRRVGCDETAATLRLGMRVGVALANGGGIDIGTPKFLKTLDGSKNNGYVESTAGEQLKGGKMTYPAAKVFMPSVAISNREP